MGEVYLANQISPHQSVAIKILHPQFMSDHARRFREEAERAAQVRHPHAVTIYETGKTPEGLLYIAMEFIPGIDLSALIVQDGPRSESHDPSTWQARAMGIIEQVCDVLSQAHSLSPPLIHRDIKPSNIRMWNSPTARDFVKLVDFGIAKQIGVTGFTREGQIPGTPGYISPEQLQERPIDHRSDLYSLGVVWYQMLTGELPFQGVGDYDTAMMRLRVQAPLARSKNPAVCPEISMIVAKLLERDPRDRLASAEELGWAISAARMRSRSMQRESPTELRLRRDSTTIGGAPQVYPRASQSSGDFLLRHWKIVAGAAVLFISGAAAAWMLSRVGSDNMVNAETDATTEADVTSPVGASSTTVLSEADSISRYWADVYQAQYRQDSVQWFRAQMADSAKWTERGREQIRDSLRKAAIRYNTPEKEHMEAHSTPVVTGFESLGTLWPEDTIVVHIRGMPSGSLSYACDEPVHDQGLIRITGKSTQSECRLYLIPDPSLGDSLRAYTWRLEEPKLNPKQILGGPLVAGAVHSVKIWYDLRSSRLFFSFDGSPDIIINSFHRKMPVALSGCATLLPISFLASQN